MIIRANNRELVEASDYSSLNSFVTASAGTISVYSITSFSVDDVLLIGEFGQEGSEIVTAHSSTAPSGNTVTLATNLVKSHPKDTRVYIIPYNQVIFYSAATIAGTKTILATTAIDAEKDETTYNDSATTSGYYFVRWFNSVNNTYGEYSDGLPITGHVSNTVGYLINHSMSEMNKKFTEILTYDMLIAEVNACLRYVRGKLKRWSNVQEFNYELDGSLVEDDYTWTLPTNYYDKNSNRSMLQIWIEDQKRLVYMDKQEFDDYDRDSTAGLPKYYTIYDGSVYITPKVGSDYVGDNIYMDYYTDIMEVDSDSDEITLSRHDLIKHWLKWAIRNITERNGAISFDDGDWIMFNTILSDAVRRESSGQKYKLKPTLNGIIYRGTEYSNSFDIT